MFRLVGSEGFKIGTRVAEVEIKSSNFTTFEYTLKIDGKTLKQFIEAQIKNTRTWLPELKGESHRVVLGELYHALIIIYSYVIPIIVCVQILPLWTYTLMDTSLRLV